MYFISCYICSALYPSCSKHVCHEYTSSFEVTHHVPYPALRTTLPVDSVERKEYPITRGVLRYFPAAIAGVARISKIGNDKHNPGEELTHSRNKSSDHSDCLLRHLIDLQELLAHKSIYTAEQETQILTEVSSLAWRALALSQILHESFGAPLAPAAKIEAMSPELDKTKKIE